MEKNYKNRPKYNGDKGKSSLLYGAKVPKNHIRLEAYGTVDELAAFIGVLYDQEISSKHKKNLEKILEHLFYSQALLACERDERPKVLNLITQKEIDFLENEIDEINKELPALKSFVMPGGSVVVSHCNVARTVCRRAERVIVKMSETCFVEREILIYFNRLSDYLFVLARKLCKDFNINEKTC